MKLIVNVFWPLFVSLLVFCDNSDAREVDLKPILGPAIEEVVKRNTPSNFRQKVETNQLTVNDRGIIKGRVTVVYGYRQWIPGIPHVRKGRHEWVWRATVVIRWSSHISHTYTGNIKVDVGHIRGAVNTNALQSAVASWVGRQANYLHQHVQSAQNSGQRSTNWNRWTHSGGAFVLTGNRQWTEYKSGQQVANFREVARTPSYIDLYDSSRNMTVRLLKGHCEWRQGSGKWHFLYD